MVSPKSVNIVEESDYSILSVSNKKLYNENKEEVKFENELKEEDLEMIAEYVQSNDKEKINRMIDYAIKTNKLYANKTELQQDLKSTGIEER